MYKGAKQGAFKICKLYMSWKYCTEGKIVHLNSFCCNGYKARTELVLKIPIICIYIMFFRDHH